MNNNAAVISTLLDAIKILARNENSGLMHDTHDAIGERGVAEKTSASMSIDFNSRCEMRNETMFMVIIFTFFHSTDRENMF
jgi:hypothetical protein